MSNTAFNMVTKYTPCWLEARDNFNGISLCAYGFYVIGYWITKYPATFFGGRLVQEGDVITQEQANQILIDHMNEFVLPEGNWSDDQKEAIKSVMHFIQEETWQSSPLYKALVANDMVAARAAWEDMKQLNFEGCDFPSWRQEEIELFFGK